MPLLDDPNRSGLVDETVQRGQAPPGEMVLREDSDANFVDSIPLAKEKMIAAWSGGTNHD